VTTDGPLHLVEQPHAQIAHCGSPLQGRTCGSFAMHIGGSGAPKPRLPVTSRNEGWVAAGESARLDRSALAGHASSDATVAWVRRHLTTLRIAGAVVAALALLIFSVNWVGLLIIAALLAVYELGLRRVPSLVGPRLPPIRSR
jgi:hypothetical protein